MRSKGWWAGDETIRRGSMMERLYPAVSRRWLYGVAGTVWTAVGLLLLGYAVVWLAPVPVATEVWLGLTGAAIAIVAARFMFARIVMRNITRIERGPARAGVFAFQGWKSYIVTVGMIGLGLILRHSAIPKPALAVVYEAIGGALLLASLLYHRRFLAAARPSA